MSSSPTAHIIEAGGHRYPREAMDFVSAGLTHTVMLVHGSQAEAVEDDSRHVSGPQLCEGLRDFAIRRFGLLAPVVLSQWNIHSTDDFGRLVFAMLAMGKLGKTDRDRIEDFHAVYDFADVFSDRMLADAVRQVREEERAN